MGVCGLEGAVMRRKYNGLRRPPGGFLMRGFAARLLEGWERLLFIPDAPLMGGWFLMDEQELEAGFAGVGGGTLCGLSAHVGGDQRQIHP